MSKNILQIERILEIFENIIFVKKETTLEKDLQKTINLLKTPLYFQILAQISLSAEPELIYRATVIMNAIIVCLGDKQRVRDYQAQILNYSTLLLRHVEFCMSECSLKQKHYSIVFICNCLVDNISACNLMMRLIPKPLFHLVEENLGDISKWSIPQWESLFKNLNDNFNSATQQWNYESREELRIILKTATESFYKNYKPLSKTQAKAFILEIFKAPDFAISKEQEEKIIQLKWNYEEYEVHHNSLKKKLPVYKYYVDEIVIDKPSPELTVKEFKRPKKFWDELTTALIAGNNIVEKEKYLKCMILLYMEKYKNIKYSNIIPYVLKQISESNHPNLIYLFIQLLFTFIENDPQNHNARRFLDANGLQVILNHIRVSSFKEDLNSIDYQELESIHRIQVENASRMHSGRTSDPHKEDGEHPADGVVYMFCKSKMNREALTPEFRKSNEIILCINIFRSCIMRTKSQTEESLLLYPMPMARHIAFQQSTIELFQNLLTLKDDRLLNAALDFIVITYLDKFNFVHFTRNKWIMPILLSKINELNNEKISIFFESVLESYYKIATDSIKSMMEDLKTFNINSPVNSLIWYKKDGALLLKQDSVISRIFDDFPGFYYLPPYFWHTLLNRGRLAFLSLLFNPKFESAFINWNSTALTKLKQTLTDIVKPIEAQGFNGATFDQRPIHYSFADDLVIGPIILKNLIFNSSAQHVVTLENTSEFMKSITDLCRSILESLKVEKKSKENYLKNFLLLTEALSMLSKNLAIIPHNEFSLICSYMKYYLWCEQKAFRNLSRIERNYVDRCLINCFKVIKNLMKNDTRQDELIDFLSFTELKKLVLEIMQRCIRNSIDHFASPTFHQLKINNIFLKILKRIFQNNGYIMVSFKDESPAMEKLFDVNQVLANLNIMLVKNFISLFTRKEKLRRTSTDEGFRTEHELVHTTISPLEPNEKIGNSKSSVFRRKMTFDKPHIVEINQDENDRLLSNTNVHNLNDISLNPSTSVKLEDEGKSNTLERHSGTLDHMPEDVSLLEISDYEDKGKVKDPYDINIEEAAHDSFKIAHKKLDFRQLKAVISHFDLSATPVSEVLRHFKQEAQEKLLQPNFKGNNFYYALKSLLQNFFFMWISVVHSLSQNRKNTISLIECGIPLICFRISTMQVASSHSTSNPLIQNINRYCSSALQIFRNIVFFCAEAVYHFDSQWKETLTKSLDSKALKTLEDNSFLNAHRNLQLVQSYFVALCGLLTMPLIALIMNTSNSDELLQVLNNDVEELYYILNDAIIAEVNKNIKSILIDNLQLRNFTDFERLKRIKIMERAKHISINDMYIESYIKNPRAIENPQAVFNGTFALLESFKTKSANFYVLLDFVEKFEKNNHDKIKVSPDQYNLLLNFFSYPSIESKITILRFLKARLKAHADEYSKILAKPFFYKAMIDFYLLYIRISHGKFANLDATLFKTDPEIQGLLEQNEGILLIGEVLGKFVSLISKITISQDVPHFQEMFIDIVMSCEVAKTYLLAARALLSIKSLKPGVQMLIKALLETKKNVEASPEALADILNKSEIIHPLLCFTIKQKSYLSAQIIAYLRSVAQKLNQGDGLAAFNETTADFSEVYKFDAKSNLFFERIHLNIFLNSRDNSFIYATEFKGILERMSENFDSCVKTDECYKVYMSVILLLLTSEYVNKASINWISIFLNYNNNPSFQSNYNQCLLIQYVGFVPPDVVQSNYSIKYFVAAKLNKLAASTPESIDLGDILLLQVLLKMLSLGGYPFASQIPDLEFAQALLKTKSNLISNKLVVQLIDNLLALCLMTNILAVPAIKFIKEAEIQHYFDILSLDYKQFIKTIEYWEKSPSNQKNLPSLPIVYKPEI